MSHAQHDTQLTQLVQWVNGKFAETWPEAADMAFAAIEKSTAIDGTPDVARSNITCVLRGALESGIYSCGCVQRGYGSDGRPVNTVRAPAPPTGSTRTHTCRDPCMQAREPGAAARHKGAIIGGGGTAAERKHDSGARAAVAAARARDKPEPGARTCPNSSPLYRGATSRSPGRTLESASWPHVPDGPRACLHVHGS